MPKTMLECRTGQRVAYVPDYISENNLIRRDAEHGVISSWTDELVFVVFKNGAAQACYYKDLVPLEGPDWVIRYTNTVVAYDGFGTLEMPPTGLVLRGGGLEDPIRRVAIDPEHLNWQETRYRSGAALSLRLAEVAQFKEMGIICEEDGDRSRG